MDSEGNIKSCILSCNHNRCQLDRYSLLQSASRQWPLVSINLPWTLNAIDSASIKSDVDVHSLQTFTYLAVITQISSLTFLHSSWTLVCLAERRVSRGNMPWSYLLSAALTRKDSNSPTKIALVFHVVLQSRSICGPLELVITLHLNTNTISSSPCIAHSDLIEPRIPHCRIKASWTVFEKHSCFPAWSLLGTRFDFLSQPSTEK